MFRRKRSRWDVVFGSARNLAAPVRSIAGAGQRLATKPVVKAAAGATGAAIAATAASAAASTARRGQS